MQPVQQAQRRPKPSKTVLIVGRYGLPTLLTIGGIVLIVMGHGEYKSVFANRDSLLSALGVGFIIVALMLLLLNWMMAMSAESDDDRAKEDEAREHFARTGRWPDE